MLRKYLIVIVAYAINAKAFTQNENLCLKYIEKTNTVNSEIIKYNETFLQCCDGYYTVGHECKPSCGDCPNGVCIKPNECVCSKGYAKSSETSNVCVSICEPECPQYSRCTKPQTCDCNKGYVKNPLSGTCEVPQCDDENLLYDAETKQCVLKNCSCLSGGYCLDGNNECICLKGFRRINVTLCEPLCQEQCSNSECIGPNQCECWPNYHATFDPNFCELNDGLHCQQQEVCENGKCLQSPEDDECKLQCNVEFFHPDYAVNQCVLKNCSCLSGGYCLDDFNECICYEGFRRTNTHLCEPICQQECEHAVCVGPNQCECWSGYHVTANPNICELNDLCQLQHCENGECLLTGECKCKMGFMKSFTLNGQVICETITAVIGKIMAIVLGLPLALAFIVLLVVYVVARRMKNKTTLKPEERRAASNDMGRYCYDNEICND